MEALTSELDVQLKLLKFTQGKTKAIVEKANRKGIERHRDALRAIVKKIESVKTKIEQAKLESGVQVDELTKWNAGVEAQQETADEEITHLSEKLVQMNYKTRMQAKECEEELAERDRQKQLDFERTQLEMRLTYEKKIEKTRQSKTTEPTSTQAAKTAKLPKLVITKFRGDLTDWPRFWSQFETEIDKAEIAGVTKYSYLKELGVKCRALLDTGAGSSYASAALLDRLKIRPHQREVRQIEMMMGVVTKPVEIFKVQISSLKGDFLLETDVTMVNKKQLLSLENPRYKQVLESYDHLKGVKMDDMDTKEFLPVHLILEVCDYTKIKTETAPLIGSANEPIAEKTRFGWTIISPGKEVDLSQMFLTQTSTVDYDNLCRLDVLGLTDCATGDQDEVYSEFKEQLRRDEEGWYETSLPWKGNHPPLPSNEAGSLRRLTGLVKELRSQEMIERYDQVIQDQIKTGIVERVSGPATGQHEFYIPHKAVARDTAETTKLRVVYDASAQAYSGAPSLNECLNPGPPLQNKLWSVLVRSRFHPVAVTGDIKQAFLQVRIKEQDRDALRFHWLKDPSSQTVETLRFTRALFGLTSSPFLLGGIIQHLLESCRQDYPDIVSEIERSLYVDDLITGGPTSEKAKEIKSVSQNVFAKGTFELHKWHSNVKELESAASEPVSIEEGTYAKEQLNVPGREGATLLGLPWDKENDTVGVKFPQEKADPSKRGILSKVARIYDPLGLASPISLGGKLLYRDVCDAKLNWDAELPRELMQSWIRWEKRLPEQLTVPRSLAAYQEDIQSIELHAFGDASGKGVAAAVYAVVVQESGVNQGLVAARARLSKKGLTIPRLELVSGHMAVNLLANVASALDGFPLMRKILLARQHRCLALDQIPRHI